MSDLPITPEQLLQLADLIEETAETLTDPTKKEEWKLKAKNARNYIKASQHKYYEQLKKGRHHAKPN